MSFFNKKTLKILYKLPKYFIESPIGGSILIKYEIFFIPQFIKDSHYAKNTLHPLFR